MLAELHCEACNEKTPKVGGSELTRLAVQVPLWSVEAEHHLFRFFKFPDFRSALGFVNRIGEIAEQEGHHPDILLRWGSVRIELYTHAVGGLSRNDFILAARIDQAFAQPAVRA